MMPFATRLDQLLALRARLDREITEERERRARIERLRGSNFPKAGQRPGDPAVPGPRPEPAVVREWARRNGVPVGLRGRIKDDVYAAYARAHSPIANPA